MGMGQGMLTKFIGIGIIGILFIASIMAMSTSVLEMNNLVKAKQTDSDIYRTHIACISLSTAGIIGSIISVVTKATDNIIAVYLLIFLSILFGAIAIGTTSKAIDDGRNKNQTETDEFKMNIATLFFAILLLAFCIGYIVIKIMMPSA